MAALIWVVLGVAAGAGAAFQAPINAQLARELGSTLTAACISFLTGSVILLVIAMIAIRVEGRVPDWSAPAPWLYVAGGFLGSIFVSTAIFLTPRLGAAALMAFMVTGQLLAGLVIDRFGLLGLAEREISAGRVVGALMLIGGAAMIRLF